MPRVLIAGGGLAGLAAAAALGEAGYDVEVFESRPYAGGRATSYDLPNAAAGDPVTIDNCQHILLRCCVNLMDFYRRLGVSDRVEFHRAIPFIEPGGRVSVLEAGMLPAPAHFAGSFLKLTFLNTSEKIAVGRALLALRSEYKSRRDLEQITLLDWLREKRQPQRAIERFWRQVLVSAINEELDRMAAIHGFQVFWLGFLAESRSYEMGVPAVPLGELYGAEPWLRIPAVRLRFRSPVERIGIEGGRAAAFVSGGEEFSGDYYISAAPWEKIAALAPELGLDVSAFEHSPITGVHLWFDRKVTDLPFATLLDREMHWFFNKGGGRYIQLVVSASRRLVEMPRQEVIDLAISELCEFLPGAREAKLLKAHVVKEVRATYSAKPGLAARRPAARTAIANLFLAGDWTASGWPATMEGAVRSGYLAAEAVTAAAGNPVKFVAADIA